MQLPPQQAPRITPDSPSKSETAASLRRSRPVGLRNSHSHVPGRWHVYSTEAAPGGNKYASKVDRIDEVRHNVWHITRAHENRTFVESSVADQPTLYNYQKRRGFSSLCPRLAKFHTTTTTLYRSSRGCSRSQGARVPNACSYIYTRQGHAARSWA